MAEAIPFLYGAGNGNRTRKSSLGSWCFTTKLCLRDGYIILLSRGFVKRGGRIFARRVVLFCDIRAATVVTARANLIAL